MRSSDFVLSFVTVVLFLNCGHCVAQSAAPLKPTFDFDAGYSWGELPVISFGDAQSTFQGVSADGPIIRFFADIPLGPSEDAFILTVGGQGSRLFGSSNQSRSLGNGTLDIVLGKPAGGAIDLLTLNDEIGSFAAAEVAFIDSSGEAASILTTAQSPRGANNVAQYAVSPTAKGLAFAALITDGQLPVAEAYGGYADNRGLRLIGDGNGKNELHDRSNVREEEQVQSIWLRQSAPPDSNDVKFKVGTAYRSSRESYRSSLSVGFAETASTTTIPPIYLGQSGEFDIDAVGLLAGLDKSFGPWANTSFAIDMSAGVMGFHAVSSTSSSFKFPMVAPIASHIGTTADGWFGVAELNAVMRVALSSAITVNFGIDTRLDLQSPRPNVSAITRQNTLLSGVSVSLTGAF